MPHRSTARAISKNNTTSNTAVLFGAIIMATIAGCGLSLTITLVSVRLDAAGFSARAIGLNTAVGGIATLGAAPFIAWAARRIGVARLLLVSLSFGGLVMLGFTLGADFGFWLGLRFLIGLSVTVLFVMSEFWIGSVSVAGARGLIIGLYATSLGIGFATGPLVLAAVGTAGNRPFYVGAALFWAAILPLAGIMRRAPPLEETSRKAFWTFLRDAPLAALAGLLHGAIEVAGISLLPVYALRAGASVEQGVLFASLFVFGNSALQVPVGILSDRVDRAKLLVAIALLGLVGALVLALAGLSHILLFEIVLLLWGGTVGGLYPVGLAQLGARYRGADLAGANAAFVMTYSLGMLIGPPLIGLGLDIVPPQGFFLAIAAMVGIFLAAAVVHVSRRRPARTLETESFS